jgi:hypothetical protein
MAVDTDEESLNQDSPKPPFTQAEKGKGRQVEEDQGGMDVDMDKEPEVDIDQRPQSTTKAPRRYSKEEEEEVKEFGLRVSEEAAALARKWRRKTRDVLIRAGLGACLSRSDNTHNDFKNWYSSAHKKPKESKCPHYLSDVSDLYAWLVLVSPQDWNNTMTRDYNILMEGLDQDERKAELQCIIEESGTVQRREDTREPVTRVKGYVRQFEGLVSFQVSNTCFSLMSMAGNCYCPN